MIGNTIYRVVLEQSNFGFSIKIVIYHKLHKSQAYINTYMDKINYKNVQTYCRLRFAIVKVKVQKQKVIAEVKIATRKSMQNLSNRQTT